MSKKEMLIEYNRELDYYADEHPEEFKRRVLEAEGRSDGKGSAVVCAEIALEFFPVCQIGFDTKAERDAGILELNAAGFRAQAGAPATDEGKGFWMLKVSREAPTPVQLEPRPKVLVGESLLSPPVNVKPREDGKPSPWNAGPPAFT